MVIFCSLMVAEEWNSHCRRGGNLKRGSNELYALEDCFGFNFFRALCSSVNLGQTGTKWGRQGGKRGIRSAPIERSNSVDAEHPETGSTSSRMDTKAIHDFQFLYQRTGQRTAVSACGP